MLGSDVTPALPLGFVSVQLLAAFSADGGRAVRLASVSLRSMKPENSLRPATVLASIKRPCCAASSCSLAPLLGTIIEIVRSTEPLRRLARLAAVSCS